MDINVVKNNQFPFLVCDNWYTKNEEIAVWKELDYYSSLPKENQIRAENTNKIVI